MPPHDKPATHGTAVRTRGARQFVWTLASYAPRQYVPRHDHTRLGLTYLARGSMQEGFASRTFDMRGGHVVAKPPDAAHWNRAGSRGTVCLVLEVARNTPGLLEVAPVLSDLALLDRLPAVRGIANRVIHHLGGPPGDTAVPLADLAIEFLAAAQHAHVDPRPAPDWLARVHDFLHDRFQRIRTVNEVAAIAGVHPVHLARVFHARFGCTVRTYLTRVRLEAAASQLRHSHQSISRIALHCGFADQSHLTRAFTLHVGVSPARYRHIRRGGGGEPSAAMLE